MKTKNYITATATSRKCPTTACDETSRKAKDLKIETLKISGLRNNKIVFKKFGESKKNLYIEQRVIDFLSDFKFIKDCFVIANPFSDRFLHWIEHNNDNLKKYVINKHVEWSSNKSKNISDVPLFSSHKVFPIHFRNCLIEISENVYALLYSECIYDNSNFFFYLIFNKSDWTPEKVSTFFVEFSKELKSCWEKSREGMRDFDAFNKIFLPNDILTDIKNELDEFLSSKALYESLNLPWKRGLMLIGPPGNGKTFLIKCICDYYGLEHTDIKNAIRKDGSIGLDMITHSGEIDNLLSPTDSKPMICVLEDIDKFTTFQAGDTEHHDAGRISLHDLLNGLDGIDKVGGIIVIATTNYASAMSEALINRPGRFDRIFKIEKPTVSEILKLFERYKLDIEDGSITKIAQELHGYSMAFATDFVISLFKKFKRTNVSYKEAKVILDRIHKHNKLYKNHFKSEDTSSMGFSRDATVTVQER